MADWVHDWGADLVPDWAVQAGGDGDGDAAFDNSGHVPEAGALLARLARDSAALRGALGARARLGLAYGPGPRMALDLFMPDAAPRGLMVFLHGGYWMMSDRSDWSVLATGALARGYAVAIPSYPLAPQASLAQISAAVARAIEHAADLIAGPIHLTGHSAGGHLVARMVCADGPLAPDVAQRLARVVPISGLHDLRPFLSAGKMNRTLQLDARMAADQSPALSRPLEGVPVRAWVGSAERPELIRQSNILACAWSESCEIIISEKCNHFDIVEGLFDPKSLLIGEILGSQDC